MWNSSTRVVDIHTSVNISEREMRNKDIMKRDSTIAGLDYCEIIWLPRINPYCMQVITA